MFNNEYIFSTHWIMRLLPTTILQKQGRYWKISLGNESTHIQHSSGPKNNVKNGIFHHHSSNKYYGWHSIAMVILVSLMLLAPATHAQPVPLFLPELTEDRYPVGDETYDYFNIDYSVPLAQQDKSEFFHPSGRWAVSLSPRRWFYELFWSASPLLAPGEHFQETRFMGEEGWFENHQLPRQTVKYISEAVKEAPPIFICYYWRTQQKPMTLRRKPVLHQERPTFAFWTEAPPNALSPASLRDYDGSEIGISPLILIGPPAAACPETLGAALELWASNAPDLVPATDPAYPETLRW